MNRSAQRPEAEGVPTIVCAFDDRYISFAGVALFSLATHMRSPRSAKLHLLQSGVSARGQTALNERLQKFGLAVQWHDVSARALADQPMFASFTKRTPHFHRLLMAYLLPEAVNRTIYLDVDLVFLGDVQDLWHTALNGSVVAACTDYLDTFGVAVPNFHALGIGPREKYFNSGVMLVDLEAWRTAAVSERVLECTEQNSAFLDAQGKFHQYDQYGMNVVLHRHWRELDGRWNFGSEKPFADVAVVHFNGHGKPWSPTCTPQFRDIFYDHLERSGWSQDYYEKFPVTRVR